MSSPEARQEQPFRPASPAAPYFDSKHSAWIISSFVDVQAALREPALLQATEQGEFIPDGTMPSHSELIAKVQDDFARISPAEWRLKMEQTLAERIAEAGPASSIDLVGRIILPWSIDMLLTLSQPTSQVAERLSAITTSLFSRYEKEAESELDRMIQTGEFPLSKSTFFGLTQTLPSFLAHAWLALAQHPEQAAKLLGAPELMPNATEELLRYAGIVQTLHRKVSQDVSFGELRLETGAHVILKLASANFDPARFDDPCRLDISRRPVGQLGLGTGPHACVGALIVRSAFAAATPIFLATKPVLSAEEPVQWTGSSLRWPIIVPVRFDR